MIALIWAEDETGGIGWQGRLPWGRPIAADIRWFRQWTMGKSIWMGRRTWESLPVRPLPGRENIVVSRSLSEAKGARLVRDPMAISSQEGDRFVIGGVQLFAALLPQASVCLRTKIHARFPADRFFPCADLAVAGFSLQKRIHHPPDEDTPWPLSFERWQRR